MKNYLQLKPHGGIQIGNYMIEINLFENEIIYDILKNSENILYFVTIEKTDILV